MSFFLESLESRQLLTGVESPNQNSDFAQALAKKNVQQPSHDFAHHHGDEENASHDMTTHYLEWSGVGGVAALIAGVGTYLSTEGEQPRLATVASIVGFSAGSTTYCLAHFGLSEWLMSTAAKVAGLGATALGGVVYGVSQDKGLAGLGASVGASVGCAGTCILGMLYDSASLIK